MDKKDKELIAYLSERLSEYAGLKAEIASLNSELVLINEQLRQSEAMKSHFISNITNELINPFASILGLAGSIQKLHDDEGQVARKMGDLIYSEAFYLDFQMNNIFEAARIEAGETSLEPSRTNIDELIQSIVANHKFETDKNRIKIDYRLIKNEYMQKAFSFGTDKRRIDLIISNILSNALKFSRIDSSVQIHIECFENHIEIHIKDNGVGISEKDLQRIYQRFKKLDESIHSLNTGSGLGLSVTKALVELLDGELRLQSKEGQGSTFTVVLPELTNEEEDEDALFTDEELF